MNMVFQEPKCVMIIGIGHESGFTDVPDVKFTRSMLAGFMSTMFICCANAEMDTNALMTIRAVTRNIRFSFHDPSLTRAGQKPTRGSSYTGRSVIEHDLGSGSD